MNNDEFDNVNHPFHYSIHPSGIEPIDVIRKFHFNAGNAVKYLMRFRYKNQPEEDIQKAIWYIKDMIEHTDDVNNSVEAVMNYYLTTDDMSMYNRIIEAEPDEIIKSAFALIFSIEHDKVFNKEYAMKIVEKLESKYARLENETENLLDKMDIVESKEREELKANIRKEMISKAKQTVEHEFNNKNY